MRILCFSGLCHADDFGVIGPVYEIEEVDLLEWIMSKLHEDGKVEKMQSMLKEAVQEKINRPAPVKWITRCTEDRAFEHDPWMFIEEDIRDEKGKVIGVKGVRVNPIDYMDMSMRLVFLDGDDPEQVAWVKQMQAETDQEFKFLLVNGSPNELKRVLGQHVYFDQGGMIAEKFGIKHVPAHINKNGRKLEIREFKI